MDAGPGADGGAVDGKRCPRCGETKSLTAFSGNRRLKDGLDVHCRTCIRQRTRDKKARHVAAGRCADCGQERGSSPYRLYCQRCAELHAAFSARYSRANHAAAISAYSGSVPRCACCGESGLPFLTLDHIDNDGKAHRRQYKGHQGMYRALARLGFPPGIRVLCFNCNLARAAYGVCPHVGGAAAAPPGGEAATAEPATSDDPAELRRRCTRCRLSLPLSAYYRDPGTLIGLQSRCRGCTRDAALQRLHRIRDETLAHYSGGVVRCACCGESQPEFLALDHINGDGARQRLEIRRSGNSFYAWLKTLGFPPGLQVLCHSCNGAKGRKEACPHAAQRPDG